MPAIAFQHEHHSGPTLVAAVLRGNRAKGGVEAAANPE
jgi:hypothetical protein